MFEKENQRHAKLATTQCFHVICQLFITNCCRNQAVGK